MPASSGSTVAPLHEDQQFAGGRNHSGSLVLSLLFLAGAVNFFDRTALSVANSSVRAELHLSATAMGWLLSAFSLAYGIAQLPVAEALRRRPAHRVLGSGLVVWSMAQACTGLVRSFPLFVVMRVLLGVGESPFYPAGVQMVRSSFPAKARGRATALMSMSQTLSLAAAPPVLAWATVRFGWRWMFTGLGLAGVMVAAVWWLVFRRTGLAAQGAPAAAALPVYRALLRRRMVWGMMLGFGGINYTNWLYTAWLPGYLQAQQHVTLTRAGLLSAVPFLAGAAGMFASGLSSDVAHRRGVPLTRAHRINLTAGMVLSGVCTLAVARSASLREAVAGISTALFCIHFAGTSGWGYVQAVVVPELVGPLSALQNFASFLLASAAPVITGFLLDRTHSFLWALLICTCVTLLGALSYATLAAPDFLTQSGPGRPA